MLTGTSNASHREPELAPVPEFVPNPIRTELTALLKEAAGIIAAFEWHNLALARSHAMMLAFRARQVQAQIANLEHHETATFGGII